MPVFDVPVPVGNTAADGSGTTTFLKTNSSGIQQVQPTDGTNTQAFDSSGNAKVVPQASAAGGGSLYNLVAAATTNAANVKASAGKVHGLHCANIAAYGVYVKLYDKASSPTVGTDTPVATFTVPAGGSLSFAPTVGLNFSTGISVAITKDSATADTTAVAAKDCTLVVAYT